MSDDYKFLIIVGIIAFSFSFAGVVIQALVVGARHTDKDVIELLIHDAYNRGFTDGVFYGQKND